MEKESWQKLLTKSQDPHRAVEPKMMIFYQTKPQKKYINYALNVSGPITCCDYKQKQMQDGT